MAWDVVVERKVRKLVGKLPKVVKEKLFLLLLEMEKPGPLSAWPNYGEIVGHPSTLPSEKGQANECGCLGRD
jgi:hypothetical protein